MSPELAGGPSFWARYRWDRIVMALALAIGLALVIYGLFAPESEPDAGVASTSSPEDTVATLAKGSGQVDAPASERSIALPDTEPGPSVQFPNAATEQRRQGDLLDYAGPDAGSGESAEAPAIAESATDGDARATAATISAAPPVASSNDREAGAAPAAATRAESGAEYEAEAEPVVEAVAPEAAPADPPPTPAPRPRDDRRSGAAPAGQPLTLLANEVISSQVSRFRLTDRIRRREPVGTIADIREDPKVEGLVRVIAFSSVRGMAGQQIVYRWRRGDTVFAEVPVQIGADTWRSYSSKYLSRDLRGRWRVDLVDGNGAVLAYTEFDY